MAVGQEPASNVAKTVISVVIALKKVPHSVVEEEGVEAVEAAVDSVAIETKILAIDVMITLVEVDGALEVAQLQAAEMLGALAQLQEVEMLGALAQQLEEQMLAAGAILIQQSPLPLMEDGEIQKLQNQPMEVGEILKLQNRLMEAGEIPRPQNLLLMMEAGAIPQVEMVVAVDGELIMMK